VRYRPDVPVRAWLGRTGRSRSAAATVGSVPGRDRSSGTDAPVHRAAVVALVEASDGRGVAAALGLARALAATAASATEVLLADLTLDAPHRAVHGLDPEATGLSELAAASRFGPPPASLVRDAAHVVAGGYQVLPGLRHHRDWVQIGKRSAATAIEAVRHHAAVVVAPIDRDLEGEPDTGSFDIEDRNVLARTVVRTADLVVVAGALDQAGRPGLQATLAALAAFHVPLDRTLVLTSGPSPRRRAHRLTPATRFLHLGAGARAERRLGTAVRAHLAEVGEAGTGAVPDDAPQRIAPGTLGAGPQDVEGWITPSVPQQP